MMFTARFLFMTLLFTLLFACSGKKDTPVSPAIVSTDSLISPEKMILIMSDVHIVESAMLLERNEGQELDGNAGYYYNGIFRKYHISQSRYDQNLLFYRQNPENFAKMYEKVIDVIETRQKKITHQK
ncbi:MAG: DUF4296 domain-containing protein [Bacteroidota bacterium]